VPPSAVDLALAVDFALATDCGFNLAPSSKFCHSDRKGNLLSYWQSGPHRFRLKTVKERRGVEWELSHPARGGMFA
jgi:hypothetical protein